ncbi:MAG TPA: hypothetical protein VF782_10950 [Allosphingosinicella sp.]
MVIAAGFRLRGRALQRSAMRGEFVKQLLRRYAEGKISTEEAITTASKFGSPFDIVPHLQANFAFTKCYIAEQSGTEGGLPGPACYVDGVLFDINRISSADIVLNPGVDWRSDKYDLSATFYGLVKVRRAKQTELNNGIPAYHGPAGFRDALEVAELLTGDPGVLEALRRARRDRFAP